MKQWISSWLVGIRKIKISTVSTATSKIKISIFPLSGWHAREGGSSRTHKFESTHSDKPRGTPFTSTWLGQRPDCNRGCEVALPHDPPFFLSVDGMLGKEALVVLTNLSRLIATNLEEPLSQVRGWVNGRIAIAVVRSHYRMILHFSSQWMACSGRRL